MPHHMRRVHGCGLLLVCACVCVSIVSVGQLGIAVRCAKADELIQLLFGCRHVWTQGTMYSPRPPPSPEEGAL